MAFIINPSA